jgi:MFS family permease
MVTIVLTGSSAGAILGALVQAFVLGPYGWRGAFWIGAILPFALVPITWLLFQESPRFIAGRNPRDSRLVQFLSSVEPGKDPMTILAPAGPPQAQHSSPISDLFRSGLTIPRYCCGFLLSSVSHLSAPGFGRPRSSTTASG